MQEHVYVLHNRYSVSRSKLVCISISSPLVLSQQTRTLDSMHCAAREVSAMSVCSENKKGLKSFLNRYKAFGGVSSHWIVVGPSDREVRPQTGGVLPYYQKCHVQPHPAVKTIANTWYLSGICVHPHNFQFRCALLGMYTPEPPAGLRFVLACSSLESLRQCPVSQSVRSSKYCYCDMPA